jgi:predicted cupin superfamily sugar epimerase
MTSRADELIQQLQLQPHPEGGYYREIHRSEIAVQAYEPSQ